ncbi:MAG: DNA methyltransferase, partial [Phycisphaerae bacterium]|nr:DNA methyltransferase [Phycisphaerae bacterium]
HYNGPVERRAGALISIDREPLESRIRLYFDSSVSNEEIRAIYESLMMTGNRIVGPVARKKILSEHEFEDSAIVKYPFKVFDVRWCYLASIRPLFSEPSPDLLKHSTVEGNAYFITRDSADKTPEGPACYFSPFVCDYDSISGHARHFPMLLAPAVRGRRKDHPEQMTHHAEEPTANLSSAARAYLASLGIKDPDADAGVAGLVWMHALAVGYSPAYLAENADGIRRDWPRVPLPDSRKALDASAALGRQVAALLDTEADVPGVTAGKIEPFLRTVGVLTKAGGGSLDPNAGELAVTAGWGHAGKGGAVMPGTGRITPRDFEPDERDALADAAKQRGLTVKQATDLLGKNTRDVYLSDTAFWRNVPANVWDYTIGGYQVIKKWLSYREQGLLGRPLRDDEAREVTAIARRLAALVLLQPALDANYKAVKQHAYAWPGPDAEGADTA